MAKTTGIGTTLEMYLGEPATYDIAGFDAIPSWTKVAFIETLPGAGGAANEDAFPDLGTGVIDIAVTTIDYGTQTVALGSDLTDAGQALLKEGFDGANKRLRHSYKITWPDGQIRYGTCKITSFDEDTSVGFVRATCNLRRDNAPLVKPAP